MKYLGIVLNRSMRVVCLSADDVFLPRISILFVISLLSVYSVVMLACRFT